MSSSDEFDYKAVFDNSPSLIFVVDPGFKIVAQNRAHAVASLSTGKEIVGKHLFEAFPDNPGHSGADGTSELRASLLRVLKTRQPDQMPIVRYDVQGASGPFHARWWQVVNTPILGEDGYVRWIIHRAEDVTEIVELRERLSEAFPGKK
jgi:PAS domain S-box-containing protein